MMERVTEEKVTVHELTTSCKTAYEVCINSKIVTIIQSKMLSVKDAQM
jgi:hypothetical protein